LVIGYLLNDNITSYGLLYHKDNNHHFHSAHYENDYDNNHHYYYDNNPTDYHNNDYHYRKLVG